MSNSVFLKPDENGNWGKVGTDAAGSMSDLLTFQSGATAIGNGTPIDVSGYATVGLDVTISGTAAVAFEVSVDGANYVSINSILSTLSTASFASTTGTVRGIRFNVSGFKFFRARISAYTSGTVDVVGYATTVSVSQLLTASASGGNDTNSTGAILLGTAAYNLLFDGTNWVRQRTAANDGVGTTLVPASGLMGYNGTTWDRVRSVNTGQLKVSIYGSAGADIGAYGLGGGDNNATGIQGLATQTYNFGYNGASFDRVRVGKVYKYIEFLNLANATGATVWTPATGKKFRLMGLSVSASAAAQLAIRDGSTGSDILYMFKTGGADTKDFDFGNGRLSTTADNVLQVYNATGSTINVWVTAWGTEE